MILRAKGHQQQSVAARDRFHPLIEKSWLPASIQCKSSIRVTDRLAFPSRTSMRTIAESSRSLASGLIPGEAADATGADRIRSELTATQ